MSIHRKLATKYTPAAQQGFLGAGHFARPVIQVPYTTSDPFIMLMDDMLDKKDETPVGGPHPHAGFETVTLVLEGELGDGAHKLSGGDFEMMTAGGGVIHTETIDKKAKLRILQLWLTLPKKDRWTAPRLQRLSSAQVPVLGKSGASIRLYSGRLDDVVSPVSNYTPMVLADVRLQAGASVALPVPADFTAFLYMIDGDVHIGQDGATLKKDEVGWLDRPGGDQTTSLELAGGGSGARAILYAGQPQHDPIVSHGPFIGDTDDDIRRLYREYRSGEMSHISELAEA